MNALIGRCVLKTICMGAVVSLIAAEAAGAAGAHRLYSGRTSQRNGVVMTLRGRRIAYHASFTQRCYHGHRFVAHTTGGFDVEGRFDLQRGGRSQFSLRLVQQRTKVPGAAQYFTAVYMVRGRLGSQRANGTMSAVSKYYSLRGSMLATCATSTLSWSAPRTS
ncbi:MAG: hypothetical protein ACR2LV_01900 [Solirubrobacteraceae bacterium]